MCTKALLNKYTASTLFIEIPRYVGKSEVVSTTITSAATTDGIQGHV